jgi:acetoin utilization protein AcuB
MLVRHFMATDVFTLSPRRTCHRALVDLTRLRIRRAPVLEDGTLVGIVSERDLLRIVPGTPAQASTAAGAEGMDLEVRHIMSAPVMTLGLNDHLETAARLMLHHRIGGVPVLHQGKLRGIITESDVFKALFGLLNSCSGHNILFEEPAGRGGAKTDYTRLCGQHGCRIQALLTYLKPDGRAMSYLSLEGGRPQALVAELRALSHHVIMVEEGSEKQAPGARPECAPRSGNDR